MYTCKKKTLVNLNTIITKIDYVSKTKSHTRITIDLKINYQIFWDQHYFLKKDDPKHLGKTLVNLNTKITKIDYISKTKIRTYKKIWM